MTGVITPVALILISIAAFFSYIQPTYSGTPSVEPEEYEKKSIQQLLEDTQVLKDAGVNAENLLTEKKRLEAVRNEITPDQVKELDKLLPSNMDGVRLAYDLDTLARKKGMAMSDLQIGTLGKTKVPAGQISTEQDGKLYGEVEISFSVKGTYTGIKDFLSSVENSLRIADIKSMALSAEDEKGFHELQITMVIYWFK